jgi:parallel beta-helix repeat protein
MHQKLILGTLALTCVLAAQDRGTRSVPGNGLIDSSGSYVLSNDASLRSHGASILITANNVSLDLNGHTVMGPGGLGGIGIHVRGANGVRISNGFVVNNAFGVIVENSNNVMLTGLQIRGEGLAVAAPPPETAIMIVQSRNVVVEKNAIYNNGLGIFVRGSRSSGNRIANNTPTGGTNALLGICYNPTDTDPAGPRGNLVYSNVISGFNIGIQMSQMSMANLTRENFIAFRVMAVDFRNSTNVDSDNTKIQLP